MYVLKQNINSVEKTEFTKQCNNFKMVFITTKQTTFFINNIMKKEHISDLLYKTYIAQRCDVDVFKCCGMSVWNLLFLEHFTDPISLLHHASNIWKSHPYFFFLFERT